MRSSAVETIYTSGVIFAAFAGALKTLGTGGRQQCEDINQRGMKVFVGWGA